MECNLVVINPTKKLMYLETIRIGRLFFHLILSAFFRYDILVRTASVAFCKDLSKDVPWKKTQEACKNSKDPFILKLEEEFLLEMSHQMLSRMTETQRQELENVAFSEQAKFLRQRFSDYAGVDRKEIVSYAFSLTNQVVKKGHNSQTDFRL